MSSTLTYQAKPGELEQRWFLVDARGQTLGRLAVNIARVLRGKHRPQFTQHINTGEHVIVINARDIVVTGRKRTLKTYDRYSGYPSGRHVRTYDEAMAVDPTARSCTPCAACCSTTPSVPSSSPIFASTRARSTNMRPSDRSRLPSAS